MVFILSKVLLFLVKPLFWVFCLLFYAVLTKNSGKRKKLTIAGLITLFFFSNSFIINQIYNFYEAPYPVDKKYDVGVVLGGFSNINKKNNTIAFGGSSDRLMQALTLYKNGKIGKILISSGSANLVNTKIKEADLVNDYLLRIGIPDTAIIVENQSRNTIENAKYSFNLLKKIEPTANILVITSAWHIPRAKLNFTKFFKSELAFYPTDYMGKRSFSFSDFVIPSSSAMGDWELIIKEWIGLIVDRFRS